MKILAVDDDPIILELLSHFIEGMTDHTLVTAECAADALEAIKDNARAPFDSFLLDIQMPVTDGIQLASQIRAMKQYMDAPILMLTARSEDDDHISGLRCPKNPISTPPSLPVRPTM